MLLSMKRIDVSLDEVSVSELTNIVRRGKRVAREVTRARILLLANAKKHNDEIADVLGVDRDTVLRVKKRYLEGGVGKAIHDDPRSGQPKKYNDSARAEVIALACSSPPAGRKRWSIRLMVDEVRKRKGFEGMNRETVRLILKKRHETLEEKDVVHPEDR